MLNEKAKESWARVLNNGYATVIGRVPILEKNTDDERISYFSGEIWNDKMCDRPPMEHFHIGNCISTIKSVGARHEIAVIGDDPEMVNYLVHLSQHVLGAKDIPVPLFKKLLPDLKSFLERFVYLFKWLIFGETEEETETKKQHTDESLKDENSEAPERGLFGGVLC